MAQRVQCGICLEYSSSSEHGYFVATQCGHIYHNGCLEESALHQTDLEPRCPACRKPVPEFSLVKLHGMYPKGPGSVASVNKEVKIKVVLMGDSGTGKTSLLHAFDTGSRLENSTTTIGCDMSFKYLQFRGKTINLAVYDCGGQDRFRAIIPNYLRNTQGVCLLYDVTNPETLENVKEWVNIIQTHDLTDTSIILMGNKIDLDSLREISTEEGQRVANLHQFSFIETSSKDQMNVEAAFRTLVAAVLEKIWENGSNTSSNCMTLSDDSSINTIESSWCSC